MKAKRGIKKNKNEWSTARALEKNLHTDIQKSEYSEVALAKNVKLESSTAARI